MYVCMYVFELGLLFIMTGIRNESMISAFGIGIRGLIVGLEVAGWVRIRIGFGFGLGLEGLGLGVAVGVG